jgi:hypothetical protein
MKEPKTKATKSTLDSMQEIGPEVRGQSDRHVGAGSAWKSDSLVESEGKFRGANGVNAL